VNWFSQKYNWKLGLLIAATLIAVVSMYYTNELAKELATEERKKIQLWANAYKNLNNADEFTDIGFLFEVIQNNSTVPVILTDDKDSIIFWRNVDSLEAINNSNYLPNQLSEMKKAQPPIVIEVVAGKQNFIYFKESFPLKKLRLYPIIQLCIIAVFLVVAYLAFSTSRNAEQNRIWVGMAKETAHQLGTPISSLAAWVEYFKETNAANKEAVEELEKDVARLEQITERFSKIGSTPVLENHNLAETISKNVEYMKRRSSVQVQFLVNAPEVLIANYNPPLFDWVFENLLKNALDAMSGKGAIEIVAKEDKKQITIDIKDSGKGIPKSKHETIFTAGYSTKKRGWGLGLTLVKRIVEEYHKGKIFVKHSEVGKGTTFRIVLNKG
jgi:two-component system, sporulation sensor kinase D